MLAGMATQTNEPNVIRAGDSITWSRDLPEYSAADGWALKYRLLYQSGTAQTIGSTGAGTVQTVTLSSATTAGYAAGAATLVAYVERGTAPNVERVTLETSPITILADLTVAANYDNRTPNQIALADAKAALAAYMASGKLHVGGYDIAGRKMEFRAADEIKALIEYYEGEVGKERAALAALNGGSPGRVIGRM